MNTKILLNERPVGEPTLGNFRTVKEDMFLLKRRSAFKNNLYVFRSLYARPNE